MDIKPVKRRHKASARNQQPLADDRKNSNTSRDNITISSKVSNNAVNKKLKKKGLKLRLFVKKNLIPVSFFSFLCALYLPASKLINSTEQYQSLVNQSLSINNILNNAVYMPQKLFVLLVSSSGLNGGLILKAGAFILILAVIYLFYSACKHWLGKNTALLSTFLFASSTWMILSSQNLSFNNIYLLFFPLVIYLNHLLMNGGGRFKVLLAISLFSIALYGPGMVWPVLGLIALLPLFMQKIIRKYNTEYIGISLILVFILAIPLLVSLVLRPGNFSNVLVGDGPITVYSFTQNLQSSLEAMFLNGLPNVNLWLAGTPIFNYVVILLFMFGLVHLFANRSLRQHLNFLFVGLAFSLLTITFVGLEAIPLIVPLFFLIAGFGIKFLLNNWYSIFPNNPVARNAGLALVALIVILASVHDISRFYAAWPETNGRISSIVSESTI